MRREQKTVIYSFNPANPAQLAKLDALHKEQLALYRFLNRPYGVLINTLVLPGLIHFLFFRENAWLRSWYIDLRQAFSLPFYQERKHEFQGIADSLKLSIAESTTRINKIETNLKNICNQLLLKTHTVNQCCDFLEKIHSEYPGNSPAFADMKNDIMNHITASIAAYPSEEVNAINANGIYELVRQLEPQKSSLKRILIITHKIFNLITKNLNQYMIDPLQSPITERCLQLGSIRFGIHRITQLIYASMSITGAIGQRLLLDPLLLKIRPGNTLLAHHPILPYLQGQRNSLEAQKEIKELTQTVNQLKQRANFNKTMARYGLIFAIVLVFYNFLINPIDSSPQMTLICLGIIATALKDGIQDLLYWRQSWQKNAYLLKYGKFLNKMTQGMTAESWQYVENNPGARLDGIYFHVQLNWQGPFSGKKLARMLEYYLQKQGLATYHSNDDQVFIPADENLNAIRATRVTENFSTAVQRLKGIRELKLQILKVIKKLISKSDFLEIHYQDEKDLPTARFHLEIADSFLSHLTVFIEEIRRAGNSIRHEAPILIITGHSPLEEKKITQVLQSLLKESGPIPNSFDEKAPLSNFSIWENHYAAPARKKDRKNKLPENQEEKSETKTPSSTKIRWGKYHYISNDETCPVKLMRPAILAQNRHHVVFDLEQKHMPAGYPSSLYQKLRQSALQAPIGAKEQGWKFVSATLCNDLTTGENRVPASAKFRNYGEFGDLRLFARSVTVRTENGDKILHRVVGLDPHAHRPCQRHK
jgi:hypothetical protein